MILTDKDLQLLNSMPSSSEPDSSGSQGDLKIEFDGTTVLCRVCGDKASGFHYGVHSCEGCKGFFRRSIQQKIQYRPCTKNQQCSILRINRNRCQYCRLKKCIAVGMSRDAVRFGRVPKREKAKILAAMQKVNQNSQEKQLNEQLEDENKLLSTILEAHDETCDYTKEKVAPLLERARSQPVFAQCPSQMACPLNPLPQHVENGTNRILEDFSERFSPAIRGVVEFAKRIPGFAMLSQDDQVTLLKAGVFEVLLVRLACMFDSQSNSMICLNGLVLRREALHSASNARFLMDSMFDFAERMNGLKLTDHEVGLFCAVVVIAPDRPGLRNTDLVQKINRKLDCLLQKSVAANHPETPLLFSELKKKIPDLRTLNTLHSEKLLAYKMEGKSVTSSVTNDHIQNGSSSSHNNNQSNGSPHENNASSSGDESGSYYSGESPVKWTSGSTVASMMNGSTAAPNFSKIRRVDSPTDSGIESGKEHSGSGSTPTTSVCSSPRSALDEKVKDVSDSEGSEKQETIDDMPMLKRALQAPPLINSNMLMDEAYRHHKKFRATKRESPSPSTTTPAPDSLAVSHSTLVRTLEQAPRYLNDQQLKRTDLIHNMIMRTEGLPTAHRGVLVGPRGSPFCIPVSPPFGCPYSTSSTSPSSSSSSSSSSAASPQSSSGLLRTHHNLSPRIVYTGSSDHPHHQRRSPPVSHHMSPSIAVTAPSSSALVMAGPSPPPPGGMCSPHHVIHAGSGSPYPGSPSSAAIMNQTSSNKHQSQSSDPSSHLSDYQPLNLSISKRTPQFTPNSSPTVKLETAS